MSYRTAVSVGLDEFAPEVVILVPRNRQAMEV